MMINKQSYTYSVVSMVYSIECVDEKNTHTMQTSENNKPILIFCLYFHFFDRMFF